MKEITNDNDTVEMGIYCIKDTVADSIGTLFEAKNDAVAIRNFNSIEAKHKSDLILLKVGERLNTGYILGFKPIIELAKGEN